MFTKKPEPGESVTKMGERSAGEMKTPFTERPTTYAAKSTSPSASKMVPSIIGEDLSDNARIPVRKLPHCVERVHGITDAVRARRMSLFQRGV